VSDNATAVEGVELASGASIRAHYTTATVGDYWQSLGIPLRTGRFLEDADNHRKQKVCVVDEDFARRYWPGESALGHRLVNGPTFSEDKACTIVGVVGSVKQNELSEKNAQGMIYYPYTIYSSNSISVVVKTPLPPSALAPVLKKAVLAIDPELPVDDIKAMQGRIDDSLVVRRSPAILAGIFAGVALLLAAVGTYGMLAYAVGERRREIGVRMALGALPGQILLQFVGLGARLLAGGLVFGVIGAWLVGRAMQSELFGVGAIHVGVFAVTACVMIAVVLLAVYVPSRRAAQVSPLEAIRED
jgi:hypothetical protein